MNPIPEPDELLESECNAQGPYGLPPEAFARRAGMLEHDDDSHAPDADPQPPTAPRAD